MTKTQIYTFNCFAAFFPKQLVLMIVLLMLSLSIKAQLSDNFADGDFSNNPIWYGDVMSFKINTSKQLQLNGSIADTSYLSTPNISIDNTEWDIWIKLSLAPTAGNNERVYLVSDQANLKGSLNGYMIYLGPNRNIEMIKQTGTATTIIFTGIAQHVSKTINIISLKITRNNSGLWSIYSDTTGGINYVLEGIPFVDNTFTTTNYFGIHCLYTISNATKFYFDDFYVGPIIIDTIPPSITQLSVITNTTLDIRFSEAVDAISSAMLSNFFADNGLGNPNNAGRDIMDLNLVHIYFASPFMDGIIYNLRVSNIKDLSNNILNSANESFGIPLVADSFDIVINEILYAPLTGGSDFVEIYNRSNKIFDLKDYALANVGFTSGLVMDIVPIIGVSYLFFPGDYVVLTAATSNVTDQYYTSNPNGFIQLPSMPQFYVDSGGVALLHAGKTLDLFQYSNAMQFPMLRDFHGVSLERINFDRPTQDKTNWHSASEVVGFATPAYRNSQFESLQNTSTIFFAEPEIFSPDNDATDDFVNFHYHFELAGKVGSITIFDAHGRLVRNLVSNVLLGTDGIFSWDGINNQNTKALIGIYIAYLSVFDLKGNKDTERKTCILAAKLY